jgi:S-adenosylmethionine uptake transporter
MLRRMSQHIHSRPAIAFAVAAIGIGTFSLMDAAMKEITLIIGAYNAVIWRNIVGAGLSGGLFLLRRQSLPGIANLKIHMWRSIVVAAMAISFFWALARLPLAEAIGLSFISPVIALYLAAVLLKERIGRQAILASIAGLAGLAIILGGRLSGDYNQDTLWGVAAVLFSAVVFAYNLILARQQAQIAGPIEIALFQNLFVAMTLALAGPWLLSPLPASMWPSVAAAASFGVISLLLLSWAYARAEAQILIPVEYTAFVWAALFGWMFFSEPVTVNSIVGTALIVAGSLFAARAKPSPV